MFFVVVMGATVTNTGSAEGCGRSWPLCNGRFVPELATAALIEFSHRAVTGVETMLVLALAAGAWLAYGRSWAVRVLVPLMLGMLFLQAAMGAWAVLYPQVTAVLALHFGISLTAFASTLLLALFILQRHRLRGSPPDAEVDHVSPAYRRLVWGTLLYVLVVVSLGAYVRHAGVDLACEDWPLCNSQVFPGFAGPEGIVFIHRLAALGSVLLIAGVAWASTRLRVPRPDLARTSMIALGLVILQALSGALVVWTRLGLTSTLAHAGIMALLFGALATLCWSVLPQRNTLLITPHPGRAGRRTSVRGVVRLQ
jgi:cytochrome c oxidase assembly protein subunit 15